MKNFDDLTYDDLLGSNAIIDTYMKCQKYVENPEKYEKEIKENLYALSVSQWQILLSSHPEYIKDCKCAEEFSTDDKVKLLGNNPTLLDDLDITDFGYSHMADLVILNPIFAPIVNWEEMSDYLIINILIYQPQLVDYCRHRFKDIENERICLVAKLLTKWPGFYRDFDLNKLDQNHWEEIVKENPEFEKFYKLTLI